MRAAFQEISTSKHGTVPYLLHYVNQYVRFYKMSGVMCYYDEQCCFILGDAMCSYAIIALSCLLIHTYS